MAEDKDCCLSDLSVADIKTLHPKFEDDVTEVWNFETSVESRDSLGGTSKRAVLEQCEMMRALLAKK